MSSPTSHPAVISAVAAKTKRATKTAPTLCAELAIAIDRRSADKEVLAIDRLYCALFALLTLTSLRFGDTQQTSAVTKTKSVICGSGVNNKDKSSALMLWATPITGLNGDSEWCKPIARHWGEIKPKEKEHFRALFPHVGDDGRVNYERSASFGFAQAQLARIERVGVSRRGEIAFI